MYEFQSYKGKKAYDMGCLSSSGFSYPTECVTTDRNHTLCICGSSQCNDKDIFYKNTKKKLQLHECRSSFFPHTVCQGIMCAASSDFMDLYDCDLGTSSNHIIAEFGIISEYFHLHFPSNTCIYMNFGPYYNSSYCTFTNNLDISAVIQSNLKIGKTKCITRNYQNGEGTCQGDFCLVGITREGKNISGCITQFDFTNLKIQPGFFKVADSHYYICNENNCNKFYDSYGNLVR